METLLQYILAFEPTFTSKIHGADRAEIEIVEQLIGHPLPTQYMSYLSYMGHSNGNLLPFQSQTTDITTIIDTYRDMVASGDWGIPRDCILIGGDIFPSQELALRDNQNPEPSVWVIELEFYVYYYAASLEGLLWRNAFMKYPLKSLPHYGYWIVRQKSLLETAKNLVTELGFQELWFSDKVVYCGERADALIAIEQFDGGGCHIYLSTELRSNFNNLGEKLVNCLDAEYLSNIIL